MKLLLFILVLSPFWTDARGDSRLPHDAVSLSHLEGRVLEIKRQVCPEGAFCFAPDSTVFKFEFTLKGCTDKLGSVTFTPVPLKDQRLHLVINAINVHTQRSRLTRCRRLHKVSRAYTHWGHAYKNDSIKITFAGTDQNSGAWTQREVKLYNAKAEPLNAGINKDAYRYKLEGRVMLGANPCAAKGATAFLVREESKDKVIIKALKRAPVRRNLLCTLEFNPVYANVSLDIQGFHLDQRQVVVKNVGAEGKTYEIQKLAQ